jgi:phosphate transport system permease protein
VTTTVVENDVDNALVADQAREIIAKVDRPDLIFRGIIRTSGIAVLTVMSLIGVFLAYRASKALDVAGWSFVTEQAWEPDSGKFGVAAIIVGTILIALVAICVAVPLAIAVALYISEYAPRRLQSTFVSLVDLMAAVPSIVYGLWGLFFLQSNVTGVARWISTYFGWIPFLSVEGADPTDPLSPSTVYTSSTFIAGIVVALMVAPIICSVMREVFSQAPSGEREGAYALGSTKWGMIRTVVLPFGKGGMIGGTMLGLGRALGETIAVYLIISPVFIIQPRILESGTSSVASLIALRYGEATNFGTSALMAAGLALFLMTLVVNFIASSVVARSRSGAESG